MEPAETKIKDEQVQAEPATLLVLFIGIDPSPDHFEIVPFDIVVSRSQEAASFDGNPRLDFVGDQDVSGHGMSPYNLVHLNNLGLAQMICWKGDEATASELLLRRYVERCQAGIRMSSLPCTVSPYADRHYVDEYEITFND